MSDRPAPAGKPSFSAALLAGGRSSRMGRDKALLPLSDSTQFLWQKQLDVLEALGAQEILWSGPARPGMPESVRIVADETPDAGPLGGIAACLGAMRGDLLIVLAVDLPRMSAEFLRGLMARCAVGRGVVGQGGKFFEPLAAVYPKALRALAVEHLEQKRYIMQDFVREAIRAGMVGAVPIGEGDKALFVNVNSPDDLANL